MLARILLICMAIILPYVYGIPVQEEGSDATSQYFSYPKERLAGMSPRILGGVEVTPHSYPFQMALYMHKDNRTNFCAGTLISNQWVLTAAHCLDEQPDYVSVVLGGHDLSDVQPTAEVINSTRYVIHEDFKPKQLQNDIGLVRLSHNAIFTNYIQPVILANGTDQYAGENATLIGWGFTETESVLSNVLKQVNTTSLTNDECASTSPDYQEVIRPTHICTLGVGVIGTCSGDSGGPMLVDGVQVGITSFTTIDCRLGMPSVFTRITEFHDWILENARDEDSSQDH